MRDTQGRAHKPAGSPSSTGGQFAASAAPGAAATLAPAIPFGYRQVQPATKADRISGIDFEVANEAREVTQRGDGIDCRVSRWLVAPDGRTVHVKRTVRTWESLNGDTARISQEFAMFDGADLDVQWAAGVPDDAPKYADAAAASRYAVASMDHSWLDHGPDLRRWHDGPDELDLAASSTVSLRGRPTLADLAWELNSQQLEQLVAIAKRREDLQALRTEASADAARARAEETPAQ